MYTVRFRPCDRGGALNSDGCNVMILDTISDTGMLCGADISVIIYLCGTGYLCDT